MMKTFTFFFVFFAALSCGNAQLTLKTKQAMEQEKLKMETLITERLSMVKTHTRKRAYYLQVNKAGCRLIVKVNDIPLGYNFAEDEGQTMFYPINGRLFSSGAHTVTIEVYPLTMQTKIDKAAWVNIKVMYYQEKLQGDPITLKELDIPIDLGNRHLPMYVDSMTFDATLPFDHKKILSEAAHLRNVEDLEKKVLAHYRKVRQMMIDGAYYEYNKMRLSTTWVLTEMHYLGQEALEKSYLTGDKTFRFHCEVVDWIALPIENYEMVICGNGKLVYLRRKATLDNVLRVEYYSSEEEKQQYPDDRTFVSTQFIMLYMPKGSKELFELY